MQYDNAYLQSLYGSTGQADTGNGFVDFVINSSVNPVSQWYANLGGALDVARTQQSEYRNTMANQYLSGTQYQLAVDDLKKAGLNPALAYSYGGSSASAASSHSFHNSTAGMNNLIGAVVQGAFSLARSAIVGENLEDLQLLKNSSAYQLQRDRQEFYRDNAYDYYKNQKGKRKASFSQLNYSDSQINKLYTDLDNLII